MRMPKPKLRLILDTNIVLDWLVFQDPAMTALQDLVQQQQLEFVTHQPALDELHRVLGYPVLRLSSQRQAEVFAGYQSLTSLVDLPSGIDVENLLPDNFPRCKDPDDQPFIALAFHTQADALVSRDKELLVLSTPAQKFAINIIDVAQFLNLCDNISKSSSIP